MRSITRLKRLPICSLLAALIFWWAVWGRGTKSAAAASGSQAKESQQSAPTIASVVHREISGIEKQLVEVAEAMPEDKFNFSPENLNIPVSNYKGVRSFAVQVKHVATSNYFIWSPLTGDKLPEGLKDGRSEERRVGKECRSRGRT